MDDWGTIRRFFLENRTAIERGERVLVKVYTPDAQRSQVVSIHFAESEIVVQSPFAMLSELTASLAEVVKVVSAESRFGFRLDSGYLVLINRCHIAEVNLSVLDGVVREMAMDADFIEQELGVDGDGNDRF